MELSGLIVSVALGHTPHMNELSREKQGDILGDLMERKSLRGASRSCVGNSKRTRKGVSINTVLKLLADAGDAAQAFLDVKLRGLPSTRVEADEVYALVKMRPKTVRKLRLNMPNPEIGALWIWIAIDPVNKLIVAWHVGSHGEEDTKAFLQQLKTRIAGKIQLTTDSFKNYIKFVPEIFEDIDYATVKKRDLQEEERRLEAEIKGLSYHPPRRPNDTPKREKEPPVIQLGSPDLSLAMTNHIEAFFTNLRTDMARMTRKGTTMSKTIENLRRAVALYVFHHNFVKPHHSLSGQTPAVFSGIDDSKWEWEDFVDILLEFRAKRRLTRKAGEATPTTEEANEVILTDVGSGKYTVFHNLQQKTAKIHLSTCAHLRSSQSRKGIWDKGQRYTRDDIEAAGRLADELAPGFATQCKMCIGSRHTLDYLGPARTGGRSRA